MFNIATLKEMGGRIWFTGDTNFIWHERANERGFANSGVMENTIRQNWNNCVGEQDLVFILGGVAFTYNEINDILDRLHGQKVIIRGPFDKRIYYKKFDMLESGTYMKLPCYSGEMSVGILMSHYPFHQWFNMENTIHVHAFCQGRSGGSQIHYNAVDCGLDCCGMTPISIEEVVERANRAKELSNQR